MDLSTRWSPMAIGKIIIMVIIIMATIHTTDNPPGVNPYSHSLWWLLSSMACTWYVFKHHKLPLMEDKEDMVGVEIMDLVALVAVVEVDSDQDTGQVVTKHPHQHTLHLPLEEDSGMVY